MPEYTVRPWREEDAPALRALWTDAFGDDEAYIGAFHRLFLKPNSCLLAEEEGRVVSAMYVLPGPDLYPFRRERLTTSYTYALATASAWRGRGIGTAVYKACAAAALSQADAACVLPAERALYPFYENANGCAPLSFAREARFSREELADLPRCAAARISVTEYGGLREAALAGMPHAAMTDAFLDLLEYHQERFDGGCFVSEAGVAAAEVDGNTCLVSELLAPDGDALGLLAGLAAYCRAESYVVRTPLFFDGPGEARPFMLGTLRAPVPYPMPSDLWWGIAFE